MGYGVEVSRLADALGFRRQHPRTKQASGRVKIFVAVYGALSVAALITVIILASTGHR
ncbi:hypothetical protein ABGB18_32775 [Nonomuraea sp. B12E4]|uniref:hypothetical protein n=1 Tax=Nonomuraea sp. B12E4 TaxID=3153564 RepID=UPI00325E11DF